MKKIFTLLFVTFLFARMIQAQERTTLNVKDLHSGIEKYIKKNYEGYKAVEAYKYDPVLVMTIKKGEATEKLVFDIKGKFQFKATEADRAKVAQQTRTTMSLKDVDSGITKYIKKNYEDYKLTEAFMFEEVYSTKVIKGDATETLVFDKEGKFVKKLTPPVPAAQPKKADSVPVKNDDPKKADTAKK